MRDNVRLEVKTNPLDQPVFWMDYDPKKHKFHDDLPDSVTYAFDYHHKLKFPIINHTVNYMRFVPGIKKIIRNGPCTIVIWNDGTKTIVRKSKFDREDDYAAVAQAIVKKIYGGTNAFHNLVNKKYEVHVSKKEQMQKQTYGYSMKEIAEGIQGMVKSAQNALEQFSQF